jgi:hypothetical protein
LDGKMPQKDLIVYLCETASYRCMYFTKLHRFGQDEVEDSTGFENGRVLTRLARWLEVASEFLCGEDRTQDQAQWKSI